MTANMMMTGTMGGATGGVNVPDKVAPSAIDRARGIKAAGAGLQSLSILMNASATKAELDSRVAALSIFQGETDRRHRIKQEQLKKGAKRTIAKQKEGFAKAGVEMEGSALDVVGDTYYDLLDAELEAETERAFAEEQLRTEQANLRTKRSGVSTQAMLNVGSTLLGGMS